MSVVYFLFFTFSKRNFSFSFTFRWVRLVRLPFWVQPSKLSSIFVLHGWANLTFFTQSAFFTSGQVIIALIAFTTRQKNNENRENRENNVALRSEAVAGGRRIRTKVSEPKTSYTLFERIQQTNTLSSFSQCSFTNASTEKRAKSDLAGDRIFICRGARYGSTQTCSLTSGENASLTLKFLISQTVHFHHFRDFRLF